ncbi:MAG TPA: hypothetical protein VE987_22730 [Polyangiaceae bacterium]|nr:hypothetical protein [Polyangiaceae bacterium]
MRSACLAVCSAFAIACATFSTSPATHSPLRDRLAAADTSRVEEAARTCLSKSGWKVDPVGGLSAGANVVTASKAKDETNVYIQPPEVTPRVTGGPDYDDPFWSCLGGELANPSPPPAAAAPGSDDSP